MKRSMDLRSVKPHLKIQFFWTGQWKQNIWQCIDAWCSYSGWKYSDFIRIGRQYSLMCGGKKSAIPNADESVLARSRVGRQTHFIV